MITYSFLSQSVDIIAYVYKISFETKLIILCNKAPLQVIVLLHTQEMTYSNVHNIIKQYKPAVCILITNVTYFWKSIWYKVSIRFD